MTDTTGYPGKMNPFSATGEYSVLHFIIEQWLSDQLCTAMPVRVVKVNGAGGPTNPPPTVDVQPMVDQLDGSGQVLEHGTITDVPSFRLQAGDCAVIMDPKPGDVGLCIFAQRDMSNVKAAAAAANGPPTQTQHPGSERLFDWADGLYLGAFFGSAPTRYLWFTDSGLVMKDPTKITLDTPDLEVTGNVHTPMTVTGDTDVIADGISGKGHKHTGVTTGGGTSGGPTN